MISADGHENADMTASTDVTLGSTLRAARKQQELSVEDVVNQIKLAARQIEALEDDDYASLPEATFVRGFVRSYAKLLQLDAVPLLALLPDDKNVSQLKGNVTETALFDLQTIRKKQLIWLLGAVFSLVFVVIVAVWQLSSSEEDVFPLLVEVPLELPESIEIIPTSTAEDEDKDITKTAIDALEKSEMAAFQGKETQDVMPESNMIRLVFDEESWLEIRDKNRLLSSQLNLGGSELRLDGNPPFSLVIGRSDAVHLYYRGKKIDLKSRVRSSSGVARLTLE